MSDAHDQDLSEVFASDDLFQVFGDLIAFRPEGWQGSPETKAEATPIRVDVNAVEVGRLHEPSPRRRRAG